MVVLGNPPYSNFGHKCNIRVIGLRNSWCSNAYYPNDDIREQNPRMLLDDYVKFIRFGQWRIQTDR